MAINPLFPDTVVPTYLHDLWRLERPFVVVNQEVSTKNAFRPRVLSTRKYLQIRI